MARGLTISPLFYVAVLMGFNKFGMIWNSSEMHVHRHDATGAHEHLRQEMLTGPALMCRQGELEPDQLVHLLLQPDEGFTAGIAVIGDEHGRLLTIAHGIDTAIRQHVQEDIPILQQKSVVPGGPNCLQAPLQNFTVPPAGLLAALIVTDDYSKRTSQWTWSDVSDQLASAPSSPQRY